MFIKELHDVSILASSERVVIKQLSREGSNNVNMEYILYTCMMGKKRAEEERKVKRGKGDKGEHKTR